MHTFLYICPGLLVNTLKIYNLDLCSSSNTYLGKLATMQGRASSQFQKLGSMVWVTTMWDKLWLFHLHILLTMSEAKQQAQSTCNLDFGISVIATLVVGLQLRTSVQVTQHPLLWGHSFGVPLKSMELLQSMHFSDRRFCTHFRSYWNQRKFSLGC